MVCHLAKDRGLPGSRNLLSPGVSNLQNSSRFQQGSGSVRQQGLCVSDFDFAGCRADRTGGRSRGVAAWPSETKNRRRSVVPGRSAGEEACRLQSGQLERGLHASGKPPGQTAAEDGVVRAYCCAEGVSQVGTRRAVALPDVRHSAEARNSQILRRNAPIERGRTAAHALGWLSGNGRYSLRKVILSRELVL